MTTPVYVAWNRLAAEIHADNVATGWWKHDEHGRLIPRNIGELLMLSVSEVIEGYHGALGQLMDDHLPHRQMAEVELADTEIRLLDIAGAHNLDVSGAAHDLLVLHGFGPGSLYWIDIIAEIVRAMEGARKDAADQVVTHRKAFEVGIAAALLRVYAQADFWGYDLPAAREEKRAYNRQRADHKPENRAAEGGKKW